MRSRRKTLSRFGYAVILFFFARPDLSGQWLRLYKGTPSGPMPPFLDNRIIGIVQADDGGFLAASNDPTGLWVKKLRTNGTIEWQRTYDLNGAKRLASDSDGYLIANDRGVLKIGRDGTPVWYRAILISSTGQAGAIESVCSTGNGGFVAAGRTTSGSDADAFAAQVGSTGAVEWAWAFGGDLEDSATDVSRTEDGGYVLAGFCTSLTPGNGQDVWVVKLSGPGDIVWQKNYGGAAREAGSSLRQTPEGGYVLGGWTDTGDSRGWILKLTATGEFEWQRRVGTSMSCSAAVATDGGLIAVAGHAIVRFSPGGDVSWKKDLPAISSDFMDHRFSGIFGVADGSIFAYGSASTPGSEIGLAALLASDGTIGSCGLIQEGSCSIQEAQIPAFESHVIPRALIPVVVGGTGGQAKAIAGTTVLLCPSADPAVQLSLSPRRLNFASAIGGPSTPPQSFVVRNAGNGPFQWTIEDAPPWLRFSATAGSGESLITVTADPAGLGSGFNRSVVQVNSPQALITPLFLEATLSILSAGSTLPPFGTLETPVGGSTVSGSVPVTGWALDDIGTESVGIWRKTVAGESPPDGWIYIGDATFVEGARPDIEAAYPGFPLSQKGGWGYLLLTNALPDQGNGYFTLRAIATDLEGNETLLGEKTFYADNAHSIRPFGTIDTPAQGGTAATNPYVVFGWVLTPQPKTVPKDGSTISVWVDSVQVGTLGDAPNAYNQYRADVAGLFPGLNNSDGPVGYFYLDISKYSVGTHTIYWVATDDAGDADGIGSRFFTIANGAAPSRPQVDVPAFSLSTASHPITQGPVRIRTGFSPKGAPVEIEPDKAGRLWIEIPQMERIEVDLGEARGPVKSQNRGPRYFGYVDFNGEIRPLPIGSTLDSATGIFSWLPGPGFLGTYELVFVSANASGSCLITRIQLTIRPR